MRRIFGILTLLIFIVLTGCMKGSTDSSKNLKASSVQPTTLPIVQPSPQPTAAIDQVKQQTNIEYAFSQAHQHPEKMLIDVINSTKETLDIAIYSLTHPDIVAAIKEAKKRGVTVRIISDKIQSTGKTQDEALKLLGSAGIPMKVNKHNGLMHLKVTIADKKVATTGSYNYSQAASTSNDEVLMVIHDEAAAKAFTDQFERMWNDTKGFETLQKKIAQ
jgi:phosphatidylserine/phosphatidylglycerophosphate/cardiolipin synthase-like enzyme